MSNHNLTKCRSTQGAVATYRRANLVRRGRFVFRGACGARSQRAEPAKMLEPADQSGLGSRQLQRSLPQIMAAMRASRLSVCRRLRDGRNLERGIGRGRVTARQRGACVVVGQGVFRGGVGGRGRGLLLRLVEVLQAAVAVVGAAVPAVPGEQEGRREPGAWAWTAGGEGQLSQRGWVVGQRECGRLT